MRLSESCDHWASRLHCKCSILLRWCCLGCQSSVYNLKTIPYHQKASNNIEAFILVHLFCKRAHRWLLEFRKQPYVAFAEYVQCAQVTLSLFLVLLTPRKSGWNKQPWSPSQQSESTAAVTRFLVFENMRFHRWKWYRLTQHLSPVSLRLINCLWISHTLLSMVYKYIWIQFATGIVVKNENDRQRKKQCVELMMQPILLFLSSTSMSTIGEPWVLCEHGTGGLDKSQRNSNASLWPNGLTHEAKGRSDGHETQWWPATECPFFEWR